MSDTQNSSFSLLNQKEIDSLIGFLSEQKNSLNSDVLSQTSIDKLIKLISSDSDRIITDVFDPFAHVDNSVPHLDSERMCHSFVSLNLP